MNSSDVREYEKLFKETHQSVTNAIGISDMVTFLRTVGWSETEHPETEITGWLTKHGETTITLKEAVKILNERPEKERKMASIRQRFGKYDRDGDGKITKAELEAYYKEKNFPISADQAFAGFDENGDGEATLEEYMKWIKG